MHFTSSDSRFSTVRRFGLTAAMVGMSVVGFGSAASAQTTTTAAPSATGKAGRTPLTAEQQACMSAKGFAPKTKPAAGTVRTEKTQAEHQTEHEAKRTAFEAAAKACGINLPPGGRGGAMARYRGGPGGGSGSSLTAEQLSCMSAKGFTKPADGTKPTAPTAERRAAFEAAAKACGITMPAHDGAGGHGRHGRHGRPSAGSSTSTAA